jgi:anti-sigma-K factor RskA
VNVKEYISSGIIESYVLGIATEAERKEFETNCATYPEILEARDTFERALEAQLLGDARQAPQHLKQQIEERLTTTSTDTTTNELEEQTPVRSMGIWKWLAAASLILMAGAAYWAITTNKKYQDALAKNRQLQDQAQQATAQLTDLQTQVEKLSNPGMKMAGLKGTKASPGSFATVYWDTASASHDVWLLVNNLPQPASGKQYQLWALLNGQPINLGVFDMDIRQKRLLLKMQNVQNAQAFAITLEPAGGSEQPTMDSMYVMGSL